MALDRVSKIMFALKNYARFDLSGQKILASITGKLKLKVDQGVHHSASGCRFYLNKFHEKFQTSSVIM
jgi:hypothetical protein